MLDKIFIGFIFFSLGIMVGLIVGSLMTKVDSEPTCETLSVAVPGQGGTIYIGAVDLCGQNLEWGNIYGPRPEIENNMERFQ